MKIVWVSTIFAHSNLFSIPKTIIKFPLVLHFEASLQVHQAEDDEEKLTRKYYKCCLIGLTFLIKTKYTVDGARKMK